MYRAKLKVWAAIAAAVALGAAAGAPTLLHAQKADSSAANVSTVSQQLPCPGCRDGAVRSAIGTMLLTNVVVNRADDWIGQQAWARVRPADWSRNFRLGWEWDENGFLVNMFAHPYHGGLYINAGRSNGLTFWESVPLAFLGSFSWEYFGETHRPALNDFFMTSFGGIALGEVFHRVASSIRDNRLTGGARRFREIAALPFDPIGAANRATRGQWTKVGENPPEHSPGSFVFRVAAGARATLDTGVVDSISTSSTLVADLQYGNTFDRPFTAPFDVFSVRLQISPGGGGLNSLRASGRLLSHQINRDGAWHRHNFDINQRFDYMNNLAFKYGGQSVEVGIASRWSLFNGFSLRSDAFGDVVLLGALDAPTAGAGERTYDFGPGGGIRLDFSLERNGITYLSLLGRTEYVHSVSGAQADHIAGFGGFEAVLPLGRGLGLGLHALYFSRRSKYDDGSIDAREYPEVRALFIWTAAARSSTATPR